MERERRGPKKSQAIPCIYYQQGRCRFGNSCHYSHAGFLEALMIRHAESHFNKIANSYPSQSFFQEPVKSQMHLNNLYIDCGLSQEGKLLCSKVSLPFDYILNKGKIDIVFVSPLNRTLETAEIIIKTNKLRNKRVIVLPELTEVLSKVCDFSGSLAEKRAKFSNFDFSQMSRFMQQHHPAKEEDSWQDYLVDEDYKDQIEVKQAAGKRYMGILQSIFPTPLENSERCFNRAMLALEIMKEIVEQEKAETVMLVSHNRILKYLDGRFNKGRATSFGNCEIRRLIF